MADKDYEEKMAKEKEEQKKEDNIRIFKDITCASHSVTIQTLEAHHGNMDQALDAHFAEISQVTGKTARMAPPAPPRPGDIDHIDTDMSIPNEFQQPFLPPFPTAGNFSAFPLDDPSGKRMLSDFSSFTPFVYDWKKTREIPIELKLPKIEDVSGSEEHGPETQGIVTIADDDEIYAGLADLTFSPSSDPSLVDIIGYNKGLEEEMLQIAIKASRKEFLETLFDNIDHLDLSNEEDPEFALALSLSLKTAEEERALRELGKSSELEGNKSTETNIDTGKGEEN